MIASSLMAAFAGREMPAEVARRLAADPPAGFTLFRHYNVESALQVRDLTASLQAAAPAAARPLLIATDQEGGQLIALGDDTTDFAGAMALGAAGDVDLTERVAHAVGRELRALGVNVNYAPVCDLATLPGNPALGIRSFGEDAAAVAGHVAATVRGLRSAGVAATAKHFPGAGDVALDPHYQLGAVTGDRARLEARELVPFRAAVSAGADLVMSGHFALPEVTGDETLPATLAAKVMSGLLREGLGFDGLAITDALDMSALAQGDAQLVDAICAVRAGVDLLLGAPSSARLDRVTEGLEQALLRGLVERNAIDRSAERLSRLRAWLARFDQPPLEDVGSAPHRHLARELAERSVTLVRDDARLLPLRPAADDRALVVMPGPADLTPADTSSMVAPSLAQAIRRRHGPTDELIVDQRPAAAAIGDVRQRAAGYDVLIIGTISASLQLEQADLVRVLLGLGLPTVTLAMRTPWDLPAYPESQTHACSYGILRPTMEATAAALFGEIPFGGRLPVAMGGLYPIGHGAVA